jgi:hypothetical protein
MSAIPLPAYPAGHTALLFVDPYNDFLADAESSGLGSRR